MRTRTTRWAVGALSAFAVTAGMLAPVPATADVPAGYYDAAQGLTGDELKSALNDIISDSTQLSYDDIWDALKASDEDPNNPNNVVLLYSGESRSKDANGGGSGDWNREHVWAKSHGDFGTSGPGADAHHLRPTDVQVNSTRGNKDFDNGGSEVDGAPGNFTDDDSYEPRDEVKGDVARMIFYMAVRYEGEGGAPDLELNDQVDNGSQPLMGRSSVLLDWHAADPVSDVERTRNDVIYEQFQNNRNPFIDHPEWAGELFGDGSTPAPDPEPEPEPGCGEAAGLDTVGLSSLPADARTTIEEARSGRTGETYENREGVLPDCEDGYYQLFHVGYSDRVIAGDGGEFYYTPDHYETFQSVDLDS
ncbi:endonuclease I [Prauserella isguenensis]|uniref:Endonuclease I n=1 Tax=Prauserella isguenensis TaxID=1470180 RepID=A0A839S6M0_9PSEU|nr:endonuclease I [Prauserella isguenensis]